MIRTMMKKLFSLCFLAMLGIGYVPAQDLDLSDITKGNFRG